VRVSKLFLPLSFVYRGAVFLRNLLYDKGVLKQKRLPVPVISVGNLSVGGSGKTSFVMYLANLLRDRHVCILLRGYRRKTKGARIVSRRGEVLMGWEEAGDEAYLLARRLPFASVVVAEDRYEGGLLALGELSPEVFILDDGFQHRKLYRELDIVLLKREDLSDFLLPAGRLREPLSSLRRADIVVRSYQDVKPFSFEGTLGMFREFCCVLDSRFSELPLSFLRGKEFVAFSALGDNEQFRRTLERLGVRVKRFLSFRDHHDYADFELSGDELYITTPKDLVKFEGRDNVFALDFRIRLEGEERLREAICRIFC